MESLPSPIGPIEYALQRHSIDACDAYGRDCGSAYFVGRFCHHRSTTCAVPPAAVGAAGCCGRRRCRRRRSGGSRKQGSCRRYLESGSAWQAML